MEIIATHVNADFDALASLLAAKKLYPEAKIILPNSQERGVREFLALVKGEISLNEEKNIELQHVTKAIIVDTRSKSRLGKVALLFNKKNFLVHLYDHHPRMKNDLKAYKDVYEPCGATVTLLVDIIKRKKIPVSPLEATIFALGIYEDTGSLTYKTTSKKDIDAVSFLFSKGASLGLISSYLTRELSVSEMKLLASLIIATKIYVINGFTVAISELKIDDLSVDLGWVTHKLFEIENYNILFVLLECANRVQIIARCRLEEIKLHMILKLFGGGGHASAASAIIKNKPLALVKQELLDRLEKNIKVSFLAKDIMSFPVKTLVSSHTVKDATKVMEKLKIKGMPVVEHKKVIGIITCNDLKRAIKNGFGHAPIKGYMNRNVFHIKPETPVSVAQKILGEKNIGRLPVISRRGLEGIISRSDIFKIAKKEIIAADIVSKRQKSRMQSKIHNIRDKAKKLLPKRIYNILKTIGVTADDNDVSVYIVGGFVRDLMLGRQNFDVDIVVEANAIDFAKKLSEKLKIKLKIHERFKTASLQYLDGLRIDVATARTEYYEYPAALPVVESSSIKHDLYRRDFTVNTLAVKLNAREFGKLIDYFGAVKDLRDKKIKVLHDLSFIEDPTRIFRAVRFEQRFDFRIEPHTENLIRAAVDLEMFEKLNKFRISEELILLLSEPHPFKVITRMAQLHELKFIHPRLKLGKKTESLLESLDETLSWHRLTFLDSSKLKRWLVYFMVLVDDLNKNDCGKIFMNFEFKAADKECILLAKTMGNGILKYLSRSKIKASDAYKILKPLPQEAVLFLMAKSQDNAIKNEIMRFLTKSRNVSLNISGNDLKKLHLEPGPRFRTILEEALYEKIDGKISGIAEELNFVKKMLCSSAH